jgi:Tfp pilus assembly protein PilZ
MALRAHFRAFDRHDVDLPASLMFPAEGTRTVRLVNIGLGGACIIVDAPIDVGAEVALEVTTPTLWDPLRLPGRVTWVEDAGDGTRRAGVRFEHERPSALRALVEMLGTEGYE